MSARLQLPAGGLKPPRPPSMENMVKKAKSGKLRTKNPFSYLSGSIVASQNRKLRKNLNL